MLSFLNIRVGLGALCFLVPSGSTNVASSIFSRLASGTRAFDQFASSQQA